MVASLAPPLEGLAQRYVLAETIQFSVFAIAAPALIVLGAPWRLLRLSRRAPAAGDRADWAAGDRAAGDGAAGPADRLAMGRRQYPLFRRAGVYLLIFIAVALLWRLPPVIAALVARPALVVLEMAMLLVAGVALWLELVSSPPLEPRLPRPQRATIAALAMWSLWIVAYVVGQDNAAVFGAYARVPARALSMMADQEIASGIMWAIAGLAFIPVVLVAMISWLQDPDANVEELQRPVRDEFQRPVVRGWGRPPASGRSQ